MWGIDFWEFPFVWPLRSWRIWDGTAQDKGLGLADYRNRVGRVEEWRGAGGGRFGNWAQSPAQHATLQASSSPASKSLEISPESLRQIIVINNKLHPPSPPISPASPPRGKTNGPRSRCPSNWTLTSPPSRWPSVSNFVCLFVYSETLETTAAGRFIFTELGLKEVGKNKEPPITCDLVHPGVLWGWCIWLGEISRTVSGL